jgi:hypothetical protein
MGIRRASPDCCCQQLAETGSYDAPQTLDLTEPPVELVPAERLIAIDAKIATTEKIVASVVQNTTDDRRTPPIAVMIFSERCARIVAMTDSPAR